MKNGRKREAEETCVISLWRYSYICSRVFESLQSNSGLFN